MLLYTLYAPKQKSHNENVIFDFKRLSLTSVEANGKCLVLNINIKNVNHMSSQTNFNYKVWSDSMCKIM